MDVIPTSVMSNKTITIVSLIILTALAVAFGAPLSLGYLDLAVYQVFAFLLLRYVSAVRLGFATISLITVISLFTKLPAGVWAEAISFTLLMLALDWQANSGRAEHRLITALVTVPVCALVYVLILRSAHGQAFIDLASAHAATFVFSTVFSIVLAELVWALSTVTLSGFFQKMSRHEVGGLASIRSLGTVFISFLVVLIFSVFLLIWSARWNDILTTTTKDLVDQSALVQLNNDVHQLELETRSASVKFQGNKSPWLFMDQRYVFLGMDPDVSRSPVASPRLIGSERVGDSTELMTSVNNQISKLRYRASMGPEFARLDSPLFINHGDQKLPVYTNTIASHAGNTFSSFLMYLEERNQPVSINNVVVNSHTEDGALSARKSFLADFSKGGFDGATVDTKKEIYTFTGEDSAGWANDTNIYPLTFPAGGSVTFTASADVPTHVYFRFEYPSYPDSKDDFVTKRVLVDSPTPSEYSVTFGEQILFIIDTSPLGLRSDRADNQTEITFRRISGFDLERSSYGVPPDQIIDTDWMGGVLWTPVSTNPNAVSRMGRLNPWATVTVPISQSQASAFELQLAPDEALVANLEVWPRLTPFFEATRVMALFLTCALFVTSFLTMALVGRLIKPVNRLLAGLEELKQVHTQVGESNTPIEPIKIEAKAVSAELNNLQSSIVWFSNEVAAADHQLRSSVTGYETLLSSLPLGVMEIDRDYQLRFRNDAMSQITGDSAEASYGLRQRAEKLFESGETLDEYALSLEGQPQRNLLLAITPRTDESGEDSGFWLLVTDLTKQKAMDSQLLQTAKLATLGEMSTGMAHELNQPLNIIKLALSNLKNSLEKGRATEESIISRLDRIDSAVARASTIIDHMRAFGRVAGEDYTPFIVSSCISTASDLVREPMNANGISLFLDVETQASVLGNAIQFEQVLINMINNARDAILAHGSSGSITIRQILEAESVTITIEDTGGGIPAEALPHIFEPFYTTKPVGKGTGLGGSISYGIIQDMQGSIWAENVIGGARISIRLPLHVAGDELETEMKV
jgi:signal transduction histidine kinase